MNKDEIVLVDIPNWSKHQRATSRLRKDWIAVSTEMMFDPAVRRLPPAMFKCWVGLLLHAGRNGLPFEFSATLARDLFGLCHTPSLELLSNQGLITLKTPTVQDSTVQDSTISLARKSPEKKPAKIDFYKPEAYPENLHIGAWENWVQYRINTGKPKYKSFATMHKLAQYPAQTQIDAVKHSIDNEYTGVFPEKVKGGKTQDLIAKNRAASEAFLND